MWVVDKTPSISITTNLLIMEMGFLRWVMMEDIKNIKSIVNCLKKDQEEEAKKNKIIINLNSKCHY